MSFDKRYPNRKDWRKPYRKAARFDHSCRPGGACPYCRANRTYADRKHRTAADEQLNDWLNGYETEGDTE